MTVKILEKVVFQLFAKPGEMHLGMLATIWTEPGCRMKPKQGPGEEEGEGSGRVHPWSNF